MLIATQHLQEENLKLAVVKFFPVDAYLALTSAAFFSLTAIPSAGLFWPSINVLF
jgi:hypothetical protein